MKTQRARVMWLVSYPSFGGSSFGKVYSNKKDALAEAKHDPWKPSVTCVSVDEIKPPAIATHKRRGKDGGDDK